MAVERLDQVTALFRDHLGAEALAGFPRLSRTPSTSVIRFLDYFASLAASDQEALLDVHARLDAMRFFPPAAVHDSILSLIDTDPALQGYRAAMQSAPFGMGLRYASLRMAKAMLGDPISVEMMARTRATLDFVPRDDMPTALVPDPDRAHVRPAVAPLLRSLINAAFGRLFAVERRKLAGGETGYSGILHGVGLTVWIDFAARDLQLRHGVTIPDETKRVFVFRLAYEDLWAAGPGWDYLTEENAEASVALLCEFVERIVGLRNAVVALM